MHLLLHKKSTYEKPGLLNRDEVHRRDYPRGSLIGCWSRFQDWAPLSHQEQAIETRGLLPTLWWRGKPFGGANDFKLPFH